MSAAVLRTDGLWLLFDQGEEAGPFNALDDALEFLAYVDKVQQSVRAPAVPDSLFLCSSAASVQHN